MNAGDKNSPYTVSGLTRRIKHQLESFRTVWLTGEITGLKYHTSQHIYLTLKDSDNQIAAVIWRNTARNLAFDLKDGLEVLVSGELTIYGPRSTYQISINSIEPKGAGALLLAFEALKKKLSQLGLFDQEHKKKLPGMPRKICVVTSPTGAAVQDMLNVIQRRFPLVSILVFPVRVQGEGAAPEIAHAIRYINKHPHFSDVDVVIVGRGGGSPEDLWAFNEEELAYAIYESRIPIISAVGHEIDITISDLVADRRALTPTEAGEIVVPRLDQVYDYLERKEKRLQLALTNKVQLLRSQLSRMSSHRAFMAPQARIRDQRRRLDVINQKLRSNLERNVQRKHLQLAQTSGKLLSHQPSLRLQRYCQRLDELSGRMCNAMAKSLEWQRRRINNYAAQLEALSPLSVLRRGYTITYNYTGDNVICDHEQVNPGDRIWTRMSGSWILSKIEKTGRKELIREKS